MTMSCKTYIFNVNIYSFFFSKFLFRFYKHEILNRIIYAHIKKYLHKLNIQLKQFVLLSK